MQRSAVARCADFWSSLPRTTVSVNLSVNLFAVIQNIFLTLLTASLHEDIVYDFQAQIQGIGDQSDFYVDQILFLWYNVYQEAAKEAYVYVLSLDLRQACVVVTYNLHTRGETDLPSREDAMGEKNNSCFIRFTSMD